MSLRTILLKECEGVCFEEKKVCLGKSEFEYKKECLGQATDSSFV
jgi:hypothetical protein